MASCSAALPLKRSEPPLTYGFATHSRGRCTRCRGLISLVSNVEEARALGFLGDLAIDSGDNLPHVLRGGEAAPRWGLSGASISPGCRTPITRWVVKGHGSISRRRTASSIVRRHDAAPRAQRHLPRSLEVSANAHVTRTLRAWRAKPPYGLTVDVTAGSGHAPEPSQICFGGTPTPFPFPRGGTRLRCQLYWPGLEVGATALA